MFYVNEVLDTNKKLSMPIYSQRKDTHTGIYRQEKKNRKKKDISRLREINLITDGAPCQIYQLAFHI
jgi:hypothetical protein